MKTQLKKCPFCGGEAVLEPYKARKGYEASIQCNGGCLLCMTTITYDTQEEAIEKVVNRWNMRMNEWIDAKNKLPEEYKSVIVYTTKKQIIVSTNAKTEEIVTTIANILSILDFFSASSSIAVLSKRA